MKKLRCVLLGLIRFVLAVLLCFTPVTAIVVLGWVTKKMRRFALLRWWRMAGYEKGDPAFADLAAGHDNFRDVENAPHLIRRPKWRRIKAGESWFLKRVICNYLGGLWDNFETGLTMLLNSWVYSMPICVLWMFSWWGGWENSFNKGYEQFWVGQALGWAGVLAFMYVMTWLPLSQARMAVSGDWRRFYQWQFVRALGRSRWASSVILSIVWAIGFAVVAGIRAVPLWAEDIFKFPPDMTASQLYAFAQQYYTYATAIMLMIYLWVHRLTARVYATTIARGVQRGTLQMSDLAPAEQYALKKLGLYMTAPKTETGLLGGFISWTATRIGRGVRFCLVLGVWFCVAFSIYLSQFLNHAWINWLNQPMIHAPWVYYIPGHLAKAAKAEQSHTMQKTQTVPIKGAVGASGNRKIVHPPEHDQ